MNPAVLSLVAVAMLKGALPSYAATATSNPALPPFEVTVDRDPSEDAAVSALTDAEADLKSGKLRIIRYGLPSFVLNKAAETLKRNYGIEIVSAGCVSTAITVRSSAVYNAVMQRAILIRYRKSLAQLEWLIGNPPNQPPEPSHSSVTSHATQESRPR
jgi:hypothetical protein